MTILYPSSSQADGRINPSCGRGKTMPHEESIWLSEHQNELEQYSGKWIAVLKDKVVASGASVSEVMENAARKTRKLPLVIKVPMENEDLYVL